MVTVPKREKESEPSRLASRMRGKARAIRSLSVKTVIADSDSLP